METNRGFPGQPMQHVLESWSDNYNMFSRVGQIPTFGRDLVTVRLRSLLATTRLRLFSFFIIGFRLVTFVDVFNVGCF